MDLIENDEMVRRAREIAPEIAAASKRIEFLRRIPEDIVDLLERNNFYRLLVPKSLGGLEKHPLVFFEIVKTFAKANASLAWAFQMTLDCSMAAPYMDREAALEIFGTQAARLVYGPPTPTASVERVEGGYKLTGRWGFASGSAEAPWFAAHVLVKEGDQNVTRTFAFPREAVTIIPDWEGEDVLGLGATSSNSYSVKDLFVANKYVFERDKPGEWKALHPLYAFASFMMSAYGAAAVAVGIAEATMDDFKIHAVRKRHGTNKEIRESDHVQTIHGECSEILGAGYAHIRTTLEDSMANARRWGRLLGENHKKNRLATTGLIRRSKQVVQTLFDLLGSSAVYEKNPFALQLCDVTTLAQQHQGFEIHYARVAEADLYNHDDTQLEALARPPAIRSTPNPAATAG